MTASASFFVLKKRKLAPREIGSAVCSENARGALREWIRGDGGGSFRKLPNNRDGNATVTHSLTPFTHAGYRESQIHAADTDFRCMRHLWLCATRLPFDAECVLFIFGLKRERARKWNLLFRR